MLILIRIIGWLHVLAAIASLLCGLIVLLRIKGSRTHRLNGKYYFYAMLLNNCTALLVYNVSGRWFFPHTLAVVTLGLVIPGYLVAQRRGFRYWLKIHIFCFITSYYMLIGGAINEAFLRVDIQRTYLTQNPHSIGYTHFAALLLFICLLVYYLLVYKVKMTTLSPDKAL